MEKIRLVGTLLCVCVSANVTDTPLHCCLDLEWLLFVLSALGVGWRIVNSTRNYHASEPFQMTPKSRFDLRNNLCLLACLLV